jgi:hypothetical protein
MRYAPHTPSANSLLHPHIPWVSFGVKAKNRFTASIGVLKYGFVSERHGSSHTKPIPATLAMKRTKMTTDALLAYTGQQFSDIVSL